MAGRHKGLMRHVPANSGAMLRDRISTRQKGFKQSTSQCEWPLVSSSAQLPLTAAEWLGKRNIGLSLSCMWPRIEILDKSCPRLSNPGVLVLSSPFN